MFGTRDIFPPRQVERVDANVLEWKGSGCSGSFWFREYSQPAGVSTGCGFFELVRKGGGAGSIICYVYALRFVSVSSSHGANTRALHR